MINRLLRFLFGDKKEIMEIQVNKEVINEILKNSKNAHPREFAALLQGKIENQILKITGLFIIPGSSSEEGANLWTFTIPPFLKIYGSVHSHPTTDNRPSRADLEFFSKNGIFHMIVAYPYTPESIAGYDMHGREIIFKIV
ncbi:Mov34/MPN/PAD-1 family protein [Methanothermus fervidus DSM 2088]|uniref:Mov34/MPN/PAD-1 family protein n=1 Tax=Methanothermus fervidus (strain ATCC 43054 / DSM 2088 / JCM 10308 / V24 S) TaxID=523846 RepID=E3GWN1_METFV|nr:Mov34/MPN/PAD-1 family protein [Methanothermus fervidus]ADP76845.1 Mov34/MPN/PAD-1 family protein [Methanothermus fervidus DSM 2088]